VSAQCSILLNAYSTRTPVHAPAVLRSPQSFARYPKLCLRITVSVIWRPTPRAWGVPIWLRAQLREAASSGNFVLQLSSSDWRRTNPTRRDAPSNRAFSGRQTVKPRPANPTAQCRSKPSPPIVSPKREYPGILSETVRRFSPELLNFGA